MHVVEIRDLDGPNMFRLEPAIKIGLELDVSDDRAAILTTVSQRLTAAHEAVGLPSPGVSIHEMDDPSAMVIAFDWGSRSFALSAARFAVDTSISLDDESVRDRLTERLKTDLEASDGPQWVRDSERAIRVAGITGTNGKTTTTRLIAHIAQQAGTRVGWSSSTGVYIDGETVLEGDYSGPSGARRVLLDRNVDLGILETARGGLLLRGLAYESNDVGIFLNVSADHLSLQGIETIETLAEVKSVVVRVTKPDGLVVLNADDPLIYPFRERVAASVLLVSQRPDSPGVQDHIESGGAAVVRDDDAFVYYRDNERHSIAELDAIPMVYGGAAFFMVENALAASGAAIGLGFGLEEIASGLATFKNDSKTNKGRLNTFEVQGRRVVIDYAHNDVGLTGLTQFARHICEATGQLRLVVGTAGDRRDEDFLSLGSVARRQADLVYLKDTPSYLRGRAAGEMTDLMRAGFSDGDGSGELAGEYEDEFAAFLAALDESRPGDVVAVMSQVDQDRMIDEIQRRGGSERTPSG